MSGRPRASAPVLRRRRLGGRRGRRRVGVLVVARSSFVGRWVTGAFVVRLVVVAQLRLGRLSRRQREIRGES